MPHARAFSSTLDRVPITNHHHIFSLFPQIEIPVHPIYTCIASNNPHPHIHSSFSLQLRNLKPSLSHVSNRGSFSSRENSLSFNILILLQTIPSISNVYCLILPFQDLLPLFHLDHAVAKTRVFSESILQSLHESMTNPSCESSDSELCRDESTAFVLKFVAMASILVVGFGGIAIPLVGKQRWWFLSSDGVVLAAAKAFAAGVILATGFVHMLEDAWEKLNDPCIGSHPWSDFPFTGFFAMMSALFTLLVDFVATQYYESRQGITRDGDERGKVVNEEEEEEEEEELLGSGIVEAKEVFGEEESTGRMHIVGMHAHSHSHTAHGGHAHSHSDDVESSVRHVVVSQVLELGIVSHSIIIGLSLGVSQSPCTMKPLIAALCFHQFFEGFALGGCISEAQFKTLPATIMACFFAITTPLGVAIGTGIASIFNPHSPGALITEGILDSFSAGILVYMALVDLIATDFLSKKMRCNFRLQIVSYCLLFLGAGLMSLLAIWA